LSESKVWTISIKGSKNIPQSFLAQFFSLHSVPKAYIVIGDFEFSLLSGKVLNLLPNRKIAIRIVICFLGFEWRIATVPFHIPVLELPLKTYLYGPTFYISDLFRAMAGYPTRTVR
ncbi:MAG TPA: hypothetical protein VF944_09665, partial [Candidatus Bathyarchaeia archaeon]